MGALFAWSGVTAAWPRGVPAAGKTNKVPDSARADAAGNHRKMETVWIR
jgi:hypothetical protein